MGAQLAESLDDSAIRVSLVARLDDTVVGYLMARTDLGDFGRAEPVAIIDTIGVDPEYAHRGVGHALLSQLFVNLGALHVERVETILAPRDLGLQGPARRRRSGQLLLQALDHVLFFVQRRGIALGRRDGLPQFGQVGIEHFPQHVALGDAHVDHHRGAPPLCLGIRAAGPSLATRASRCFAKAVSQVAAARALPFVKPASRRPAADLAHPASASASSR